MAEVPPDMNAVKARVRALLAKTSARGCTEQEAMEAARKAFEIMQKHGLDEDLVQVDKVIVPLGRKRRTPADVLWGRVASACRCRAYMQIGGEQLATVYLGSTPWPEVASWLHEVVAGAVARATREFASSPAYKRRRTAQTRANARAAFLHGFIATLCRKIVMLVDYSAPEHRRDIERATKALEAEGPMRSAPKPKIADGGARFSDARAEGHRQACTTTVAFGLRGAAKPLALPGKLT